MGSCMTWIWIRYQNDTGRVALLYLSLGRNSSLSPAVCHVLRARSVHLIPTGGYVWQTRRVEIHRQRHFFRLWCGCLIGTFLGGAFRANRKENTARLTGGDYPQKPVFGTIVKRKWRKVSGSSCYAAIPTCALVDDDDDNEIVLLFSQSPGSIDGSSFERSIVHERKKTYAMLIVSRKHCRADYRAGNCQNWIPALGWPKYIKHLSFWKCSTRIPSKVTISIH